jgi:hypothetical protein
MKRRFPKPDRLVYGGQFHRQIQAESPSTLGLFPIPAAITVAMLVCAK